MKKTNTNLSVSRESYNLFAMFLQIVAKMIRYFTGKLCSYINQQKDHHLPFSWKITITNFYYLPCRQKTLNVKANDASILRIETLINKIRWTKITYINCLVRNTWILRKRKIQPRKHLNSQKKKNSTEKTPKLMNPRKEKNETKKERDTQLRLSNKKAIKRSKSKEGMRENDKGIIFGEKKKGTWERVLIEIVVGGREEKREI